MSQTGETVGTVEYVPVTKKQLQSGRIVVERLRQDKFLVVKLDADFVVKYRRARQEASRFFSKDAAAKERYGVKMRDQGYRPFSYANAGDPEKPDLNDSFILKSRQRGDAEIPHHEEIRDFLGAARDLQGRMTETADVAVASIGEFYQYPKAISLDNDASFFQGNGSPALAADSRILNGRSLRQTLHQDETYITGHKTGENEPGLEVMYPDGPRSLIVAEDELLLMAASTLTMMSGGLRHGELEPCYHQVRNHPEVDERYSFMFFGNPWPYDGPIPPYIETEENAQEDSVNELIINGPKAFGLQNIIYED